VVDAAHSDQPPGTLSRVRLRGEPAGGSLSVPAVPVPVSTAVPASATVPASEPTTATVRARDTARASSHGLGLAEAVALGDALARLPAEIVCYTIAAGRWTHGAPLTPGLARVVETAAVRIADEILAAWHHRTPPSEPSTSRNTGTP